MEIKRSSFFTNKEKKKYKELFSWIEVGVILIIEACLLLVLIFKRGAI
jgi:hypothetical protein